MPVDLEQPRAGDRARGGAAADGGRAGPRCRGSRASGVVTRGARACGRRSEDRGELAALPAGLMPRSNAVRDSRSSASSRAKPGDPMARSPHHVLDVALAVRGGTLRRLDVRRRGCPFVRAPVLT